MRPQIVKNISLFLIHFFVYVLALGQEEPPPPEKTGPPPPGLPIDENLPLLAIAGLIFGLVFLLLKKRKSTN